MPATSPHIIHTEAGRLSNARPGATTSPDDVRALIAEALAADEPSLVLHFHGGLVDQASGRKIAAHLAPVYEAAGRYPIFFVWEAGLIESIQNNLDDILKDKLFQQGVKKLTRWLLRQLPAAAGLRGAGGAVDVATLESEYDAWFAGTRPSLPTALQPATGATPTLRGAQEPADEVQLATEIQAELEFDLPFQADMQTIHDSITPAQVADPQPKASGVGAIVSPVSEIAPRQVDQAFNVSPQARGVFSLAKLAIFLAKALHRVIVRFRAGRDHGVYTTIVEELLASLYVDKIGGVIWRQMKKDTLDAFADPATRGGAALVHEIATQQSQSGKRFKRIVLIGHSTGAVFISNFLDHAAPLLPDAKFDVIFLAPAVSYQRLHRTLAVHGQRIANVRRFGMQDATEAEDVLVPIIYPRSLLYFVSGLLESTEQNDPARLPDLPLVGMQRFSTHADVFTSKAFPEIEAVEQFLGGHAEHSVWSLTAAGALQGNQSRSRKHGDFDNDPTTVASLKHILDHGF